MGIVHSKATSPAVEGRLKGRGKHFAATKDRSDLTKYEKLEGKVEGSIPTHQTDVALSQVAEWEQKALKDPKNRLAMSALVNHDANKVLSQRTSMVNNTHKFNIKITTEGSPMTNQRASGRCWLFAATNVFRVAFMKEYNLKELELSQSYLFYWDKIEKSNYFLEQILDTADEPLDGRLLQTLMQAPVSDGGQWDMVANLVSKYGLVPQSLYPDSFHAKSSGVMDNLITTKLRENALELRSLAAQKSEKLAAAKDRMLQEIHLILTLMLGPPPNPQKKFTWEFYDKNDKFHSVDSSPKDFCKVLASADNLKPATAGTNPLDLFSLVNDPRNEYGTLLSVSRLGNVIEGREVTYVNVEMSTMKDACISMLKAGIPIFFGSDVGKFSERSQGIMDTGLIDFELGFNIKLGLSKSERLRTGESAMTHAMVLTAVHVVNDKPVRWRVENSWGTDVGNSGWFVMTDAWMDQFVYQVVVDPRFVDKSIRDVLKTEPKILPLWDPMGALA